MAVVGVVAAVVAVETVGMATNGLDEAGCPALEGAGD
jgi:hypothetical protein